MKIVFICNEYPPSSAGGIGTFTRGLAEALVLAGNVVHVVGTYALPATQHEQIAGVRVTRLPANRRASIIADRIILLRELNRVAGRGAIDVLEAPDFEGPTACLPRRSAVRLVRLHGSHRYFSDERNVRHSPSVTLLERIALRQADSIVSVSDYTARRTSALFGLSAEITTIHNAVNVRPEHPRKVDYTERQRAVYFGTLAEKKGVLALAAAWRSFHRAFPQWRLTAIGRDALHRGRSVKGEMCRILGDASASVEFTGYLPNERVLAQLAQFDLAILPSFSEAFALAPMEAMALGVPVVYSSLSSGPELIEDGADGWLCDPRSIESIERALAAAAASAEQRRRVGQNARRKIETRFSYQGFVARNLAVYEALLSRRGQRV